MMQLLCDGVRLDLPSGVNLQFKQKNPIFAFDNMECERTTEFSLPSTPTNDSVFAIARIPAYPGSGMRVRFAAQLQDGAVVQNGYLYVSQWSGKEYKAIFVCGELVGLQAIRDAGSAREVLAYNSLLTWNDSAAVNANVNPIANIGIVNYEHQTPHLNPSVSLKWLIDEMVSALGVQIDFTNASSAARTRLFESKEEYGLDNFKATIVFDPTNPTGTVISPTLGVLGTMNLTSYVWRATAIPAQGSGYEWDTMNAQLIEQKDFKQIFCNYEIVLKFPEDTPENLCVVSGDIMTQYQLNDPVTAGVTFLDQRQFHKDANNHTVYTGEPLAGREVVIPANTAFVLIDGSGYWYTYPTQEEEEADLGYYIGSSIGCNVEVEVSVNHKWVYGENVPYNAILPDLTLVELCKIYAAITGNALAYNDAKGLYFEPIDFSTFTKTYLQLLTAKSEVKRTFSDYAQHNFVRFDSAKYVLNGEKIIRDYPIVNANLTEDKDILSLKVSEGRRTMNVINGVSYAHIRIPDYDEKTSVADASLNDTKMLRVSLPKNQGLATLCKESTQYKVELPMTLFDYERITPQTIILLDGTEYVWTDSSWQKNIAKFTLAKI